MNFDIKKSIMDYPIVAFDTETSGAYPLESEVIELGAVKFFHGKNNWTVSDITKTSAVFTSRKHSDPRDYK